MVSTGCAYRFTNTVIVTLTERDLIYLLTLM